MTEIWGLPRRTRAGLKPPLGAGQPRLGPGLSLEGTPRWEQRGRPGAGQGCQSLLVHSDPEKVVWIPLHLTHAWETSPSEDALWG